MATIFDSSKYAMRNQTLIGIAIFVLGLGLAWEIGEKIVSGDTRILGFAALGFAACAVAVATLRNWRMGLYLFLFWMLFEDLVRKYMGNDTLLFFGKDVLLAFVYVAFVIEVRRRREKTFRPPFLLFLGMFFWLATLQMFNSHSPSILYGLLGLKLYFYYVPLVFLGYALIHNHEDLRKLLFFNSAAAVLIGGLGIAQAILGNSFLNPATLAPYLEELGDLNKATPFSGQMFSLPASVFVSSGRFVEYLIFAFIFTLTTVAYLMIYPGRGRKLSFLAIAILGAATLLSGSRTAVMYVLATGLALPAGFLWGVPWRGGKAHRLVRGIRRSLLVGALGLAGILLVFPQEAGTRVAFYSETLVPGEYEYGLAYRGWNYPIQELSEVFDRPNWIVGNGTGTASLGTQYVSKVLGTDQLNLGVEEGFGSLIVEMGILAPFLWLLWSGALLYQGWKVAHNLRQTHLFPVGIGILWYGFLILLPMTYAGLSAYENYLCNAFLWLFVGVLFRLPNLLASPTVVAPSHRRTASVSQA